MKAITAVCATGASVPAIASGRVQRHRDGENAEIQMYLSKLKDLVPFMPKNRKLSKLEVIQNVIDYICDLQSALETHPAVNTFDPVQALASHNSLEDSMPVGPRQPLGVRPSPNTILANALNMAVSNATSAASNTSEAPSNVTKDKST
uniref:Protein extra-macrochaetae n=1 Tax=Culex pipiens TaxID=7175 RepID=A0A8D8HFS5_CULPI